MKTHRTLVSSLMLAAGAGSLVRAQSSDIPIRYVRPMTNTVSVGVRLTQSSSSVKFSDLGSIVRGTYDIAGSPLSATNVGRVYDNGVIANDLPVGATGARDTTTIYVYDNRPVADGKAGVVTTTLNPIGADGRMIQTVLDYKKQLNADGVPYFAKVTTVDGKEVTTYETRYELDANGNKITEEVIAGYYVPQADGYTRFWSGSQGSTTMVNAEGQTVVVPGRQFVYDSTGGAIGVNMDIYGARTTGTSKEADMESGTGFELSFERTLRRQSLRFEWGLKGTVGISGINGKTSGDITADFVTLRQTYVTGSQYKYIPVDPRIYAIPATLTEARSFERILGGYSNYVRDTSGAVLLFQVKDSQGNVIKDSAGNDVLAPQVVAGTVPRETTIPLGITPLATADGTYTTEIVEANSANIKGSWQVKGAYYMLRFGPSARFYFSPRISVSATAGLGVAYYSSRFNIDETLITTLASSEIAYRTSTLTEANGLDPIDNTKKGVTVGPVGEINAEFWVTARTGFYAGVAYEKLGEYTQRMGVQKASVNLGTGTTFRFGINTRF